jgi:hypothetical protein
MNSDITTFGKTTPTIFPMIDDLVNSLYTDEINNLIDTKCKTIEDKRVFLMFIIMYFYTYLNISQDIKEQFNIKKELKIFLTDIIKNPEKRSKCIELYTNFEQSIKFLKN